MALLEQDSQAFQEPVLLCQGGGDVMLVTVKQSDKAQCFRSVVCKQACCHDVFRSHCI